MSDTNPAGWQPDPTGRHEHRYWDGTTWTDNISDAGVAGTDPFTAAASPVPDATAADAPAPPVAPADTTAAWSTTPPAAAAPAGGGGSSKKGLLIGGGLLALIAIVVAVLLLSGGDDEKDEVRGDLIGALTNPDQGNLSQDDAECVTDRVMDDVDLDVLQEIDFESNDNDPPASLQSALTSAYEACDVSLTGENPDETTTTEGSDDETTTTESSSSDGGSSDDGNPLDEGLQDYLDQLATTFETAYGLSSEQSECLANRLGEAITSGELTEAEAVTGFSNFLADCDISMSDIGAG